MNPEPQNPVDLDELYQEIILDHFKHPRNAVKLSDEEALVDEENPTCGDRIKLTAAVKDGEVTSVKYEAHGCAISTASASMMSEAATGRSISDVRAMVEEFTAMMRGEKEFSASDSDDIVALEGVRRYPLRIKCATMPWHAISKALDVLS